MNSSNDVIFIARELRQPLRARPRASRRPAGCDAGPPVELLLRLRDEHVEAADRLAAGGRRVAQQPRGRRVVDQVVDVAGRSALAAGSGVSSTSRLHADRRAVDQQIPAARLAAATAPTAPATSAATSLAPARDCARARVTAAAARRQRHRDRARRAAGAEDRRAQAGQRHAASPQRLAGIRRRRCCRRSSGRPSTRIVLIAPMRARDRDRPRRRARTARP